MGSDITYPTPDDIFTIHEDIVDSDPDTESGVISPDAVSSALTYVSEGYFGQVPETIHEKAAHLMRLLVADHPFVDGNKRTALDTVAAFYVANGYVFDHDDEVREILKGFATDASAVDIDRVSDYCRAHAQPLDSEG
jgi:death-on-curing protein